MLTLWWLGVCYPEAFSNPRIMGLISSVSKETFSFCHCWHLLRNLKRSLTLLPSSPIVLTVITQMLIAQKAAVRLGFKSPVDASGVISRINESEALRVNELLWASSTDEAFAWVGQCGQPVSDDAADAAFTDWKNQQAECGHLCIASPPLQGLSSALFTGFQNNMAACLTTWATAARKLSRRWWSLDARWADPASASAKSSPEHLRSPFWIQVSSLTGQESKQQVSSLFFFF